MATKDWKKIKDTKKSVKWNHKEKSNALVHVYFATAYDEKTNTIGGKIEYVFFARKSEPKYIAQDIKGKTYVTKRFQKRSQALKEAKKYMRNN